jgi:hypothetical protein
MNRFFYIFMLALLAILVIYWFIDGKPMDEGYQWLFAAWALITGGAYFWDKTHGKRV